MAHNIILRRHASAVARTPLTPVQICLPLRLDPLPHLFETTKGCLGINFIPSLLSFTGGVISFHYESILDLQDECPLFLCYSPSSGTGEPAHKLFYGVVHDLIIVRCNVYYVL